MEFGKKNSKEEFGESETLSWSKFGSTTGVLTPFEQYQKQGHASNLVQSHF